VQCVRAAAATAVRYGDCPTCSALLNPIAAEAFALVGDAEGARSYADSAAQVASMFESSAWRAMAQSAAGGLALAVGNVDAAAEHLGAARGLYDRAHHPFWAERSLRLGGVTAG
jgi:hypothetical protein